MNAPRPRGGATALEAAEAPCRGPAGCVVRSPTRRPVLVYALYGGVLYGTERMAMATAAALSGRFDVQLIAPAGVMHDEAARLGLHCRVYRGLADLARQLGAILAASPRVVFLATRMEHSIVFWGVNLRYRRAVTHRLVVHGGGGKDVYSRNRWLEALPVEFIAVSGFVRECLVAAGIPAARIEVAENFLSRRQIAAIPARGRFTADGVRRVVLVSRLEPVKRVDLLLDALDQEPRLAATRFDVYGDGSQLEALRARARRHANVVFHGFVHQVVAQLAQHDLLLHTAPLEPFGLVVLEAMAAGLPALVPDHGGPAAIVVEGQSGWHYRAGDAADLAARLLQLQAAPAAQLADAAAHGRSLLAERYSQDAAAARYGELLSAGQGPGP